MLRAFGAKIGVDARVYSDCKIWLPANLTLGDRSILGRGVECYNQGMIEIGSDVVVSQGVTLCASTHEFEDPLFPLVLRPITIGNEVWVAAESFVGPGVTIGSGAVLGARGVAMRNLDPWTIYSGNLAKPIRSRRRP
ncbi:hypothetical protein GCM10023219_28840 [Stakelama sediminis]|uniref:Putative colanic acid biosynthesis acetyltransferase WcaF n=1 Tax=Stakelama sediminis TaxID=463200 RepID=A0A840Z3U5_9SPHN|nr:putative colanic acid biosynthesis acetyltransferase [Stakelama sediminis]MBB5720380.1 putative colanic acid biosynthesis acetyltransferase WcaF [Stakelama sediminis]